MLTVGAGTAAVLSGEDDLSTWSDEELAYGRRRDRNGHWTGTPPKVVPVHCVREMNRRKLFETEGIIRNACTHAASYLDSVVRGKETPVMGRLRAAETILDRFLGKPKESVSVNMSITSQVEELPWSRLYA